MAKFSMFILLALTAACSPVDPYDYERIADRITKQTAIQLMEEKKLVAVGTGGSAMGDIKRLAIAFDYYHPVDLKEGRNLVIYAAQTYLKNINESKEVRPYLQEYPFPSRCVGIRIFIYGLDKKALKPGNIRSISIDRDVISYKIVPENEEELSPLLKEETYEEAVKLVAENNDSNLPSEAL